MVDFKKTPMTKEQAEIVRDWRVNLGFSWRTVAGLAAKQWPELNIKTHQSFGGSSYLYGPDGYQGEGMDLCSEAAEFFGENAGDEPWN